MMPDIYSMISIVGITGLGVLLHELLIKNHVSTKGNRIFFYFLIGLHLLAFQKFSFPNELNFIGNSTSMGLETIVDSATISESADYNLKNIIILIYLIGVAFGLMKMILGIVKMIKLIRKSSLGKHKFEKVVNVSNFQSCTFFNYILIPADLPKDMYNSVYRHEIYHVHQMHTIDMVIWHLLSVLFWFNPFVHLLKTGQSRNLEYDTDKHMIQSIPKDLYAEHLLSSTFKSSKIDFYPMFNKSNIYLRIKKLHQHRERKRSWSRLTLIFAFTLLFGSTILSKASFLPQTGSNVVDQISKPEFSPNGLGHYIESVLQQKIGDRFADIDEDYVFYLYLNITIDKEGNVANVSEDKVETIPSDDQETDDFTRDLLIETIQNMPRWIPAKENGIGVKSVIHEEFHFTGKGE